MDVNPCTDFNSFISKADAWISQTKSTWKGREASLDPRESDLMKFFLNNQRFLSANRSLEANEKLHSIFNRIGKECPPALATKIKCLINQKGAQVKELEASKSLSPVGFDEVAFPDDEVRQFDEALAEQFSLTPLKKEVELPSSEHWSRQDAEAVLVRLNHRFERLFQVGLTDGDSLTRFIESFGNELLVLNLKDVGGITDDLIETLSVKCAQVQEMQIRDASISDLALFSIASNLSKIKKLTLENCSLLTDTGLAYLSNTKSLEELSIIGCEGITAEGIAEYLAQVQLKHLTFVNDE